MKILRILTLLLAACAVASTYAPAKKTSLKLKVDKKQTGGEEEEFQRGSFMVASGCRDCNNGYQLDQISFSGFEKPQSSMLESFFITNSTDRTLTGVTLYIEYLDAQGRQLHKRFLRLSCDVPPGETRRAELKSWDKQNTFYYRDSAPSRRQGASFTVRFDPVAYWLCF